MIIRNNRSFSISNKLVAMVQICLTIFLFSSSLIDSVCGKFQNITISIFLVGIFVLLIAFFLQSLSKRKFEITGSPGDDWSKGKFEITGSAGEDCSDIGKAFLNDAAECQEAALELALTYGGDIFRMDYPKGCFTGHNRVYWNRHEIGTSSEHYFPVCKKEGNYNH